MTTFNFSVILNWALSLHSSPPCRFVSYFSVAKENKNLEMHQHTVNHLILLIACLSIGEFPFDSLELCHSAISQKIEKNVRKLSKLISVNRLAENYVSFLRAI